jgi:hypothetical protein
VASTGTRSLEKQADKIYSTRLVVLPVAWLVKAKWNYKQAAAADKRARFKASIKHDGTVGVLQVRQIGPKRFEVFNGNHRLDELHDLGWKVARCENFGKITQAEAISIARRHNEEWFPPDLTVLSKSINSGVLPHISLEILSAIFPESPDQLNELIGLSNFDWNSLPEAALGKAGTNLSINVGEVTPGTKALWEQWLQVAREKHGCEDKAAAFNKALELALSR